MGSFAFWDIKHCVMAGDIEDYRCAIIFRPLHPVAIKNLRQQYGFYLKNCVYWSYQLFEKKMWWLYIVYWEYIVLFYT